MAQNLFENVFNNNQTNLNELFNNVEVIYTQDLKSCSQIKSEIMKLDILEQVKDINDIYNQKIYLNRNLSDLKINLYDNYDREHSVIVKSTSKGSYKVIDTTLPHSPLQTNVYNSLNCLISAYREYIIELDDYFYELDRIDKHCWIVDPIKPTYKDAYRRIVLGDRVWLFIEITHSGKLSRVNLLGSSDSNNYNSKLQSMLTEQDANVLDTIMNALDISVMPHRPTSVSKHPEVLNECAICLSNVLQRDGSTHVALPLCQNKTCAVYYHRSCLYQWLVACNAGVTPKTGIACGSCPNCLTNITCTTDTI